MFLGGRDRLGRSGRLGHDGDSLDRAEQGDHAQPEDGVVVDHEQAQVWLAHASAPTALIMAASGTTTRTSVPPETAAEIVTRPPTPSARSRIERVPTPGVASGAIPRPSSVPVDRTSVVSGTRVSARVALGGRRIIKNKNRADKST